MTEHQTYLLNRLTASLLTVAFSMLGGISLASADSMTLNTYYPSPYGAYDRVRLVPGPLRSGACEIGTLYYYEGSGSDDNQPFVCIDPQKDGTGEWGPLVNAEGPIWTQDGDYIYPTDDPTSPLRQLLLGPRIGVGNEILEIAKDDTGLGQDADISLKTFSATQASRLEFRRSRGTHSAPAAVNSGDMIGEFIAGASTGVSMPQIANIAFYMAAAASPGSTPGYLRFLLCPQGSTAWREIVRLTSEGDLGIGTSIPRRQLHVVDEGEAAIATESINLSGSSAGLDMLPASGQQFSMKAFDDRLMIRNGPNVLTGHSGFNLSLSEDGQVALGHEIPDYDLHIKSDDGTMTIETNPATTAGPSAALQFLPAGISEYALYSTGDRRLKLSGKDLTSGTWVQPLNINNLGHIAINRPNTPAHAVDVSGDVRSRDGGFYRAGDGCLFGTCTSDERLKDNITPLRGNIEKLTALEPTTFNFIDEKYGKGLQTGLIAQEVEKIFPEWVKENDDGYKAIHYGTEIQMAILQTLKELKSENDRLRAELNDINTQIQQYQTANSAPVRNSAKVEK